MKVTFSIFFFFFLFFSFFFAGKLTDKLGSRTKILFVGSICLGIGWIFAFYLFSFGSVCKNDSFWAFELLFIFGVFFRCFSHPLLILGLRLDLRVFQVNLN